jgi:hypothetical protein
MIAPGQPCMSTSGRPRPLPSTLWRIPKALGQEWSAAFSHCSGWGMAAALAPHIHGIQVAEARRRRLVKHSTGTPCIGVWSGGRREGLRIGGGLTSVWQARELHGGGIVASAAAAAHHGHAAGGSRRAEPAGILR